MTFLTERDRRLAISRRVEGILAEIEVCDCAENLLLLEQRGAELTAELPPGIERNRHEERLQDAIAERLRALRYQEPEET